MTCAERPFVSHVQTAPRPPRRESLPDTTEPTPSSSSASRHPSNESQYDTIVFVFSGGVGYRWYLPLEPRISDRDVSYAVGRE